METKKMINRNTGELAGELWKIDKKLKGILLLKGGEKAARDALFGHLNAMERKLYDVNAHESAMHPIEKNNAKHCARVLKNIIRTEYEKATGASALSCLTSLARGQADGISEGFACEMIALFSGLNGKAGTYAGRPPAFLKMSGRKAAIERSRFLDSYSGIMEEEMGRYGRGMEPKLAKERENAKKRIMKYFGASGKDWEDYAWQFSHAIRDLETLKKLASLTGEEEEGARLAGEYGIPFQITPYYLSLFLGPNPGRVGRAIRAQVIPSPRYCKGYVKAREKGESLDFMGEGSTSPIDCVTRRYPEIVILKPYDSCPQICVYCQRNWEIKSMCEAKITKKGIAKAIEWIGKNPHVREVLVTGGDPFTLQDSYLEWIISALAKIQHVERIRIGTRTIVTVPSRITPKLVAMLAKYHEPGRREICIVTHVEHPTELTEDVLEACRRIRKAGMSMYNQQVFTYYNSKRFETCSLRRELKLFGIDPYYCFNTKGKDETLDFRVPIARIEQERKEEARLLPGIVRTDELVFNVPRLGKSHLRAWQDHEIIMVTPQGRRIYRFYPWESKLELVEPYDYADVSIHGYLKRLEADGEDVEKYKGIWYYF